MNRRKSERDSVAPWYWQPVRWLGGVGVCLYYRTAYRVTGWGRLPRRRGPTLLLINHQHDIESSVIVATMTVLSGSWRYPIFTVSSRRMWEPDFMAQRIPWVRPFVRGINFGHVFSAMGMQPIENELHSKPLLSVAYMLTELHGDLPVNEAFRERVLSSLPAEIQRVSDLLNPVNSKAASVYASLSDLREPYRSRALERTREQLEADSLHFERLVKEGATLFLAPEGFYTKDGRMQRLRGLLPRLLPLASVWLCGISYDMFVGRNLWMLYRCAAAVPGVPLDLQLKRLRPVTVSALLGTWLYRHPSRFTEREAVDEVRSQLEALPRTLFVEPGLRRRTRARVHAALAGLQRLGIVVPGADGSFTVADERKHPQWPRTDDVLAYQANFHEETLAGAASFEPSRVNAAS